MKKIIKNFTPLGGKHCITNALKQIFYYHGHPLTEEMIFGLGSGLAFSYVNLAHSPMISGRTNPFEFEEKLAERLGITIKCAKPQKYETAFLKTKKMLDNDCPVMLYADMCYLDYLGLDSNSHFGGHGIVLFGYDDEQQVFYVSDRDNHDFPIRTPLGEIASDFHLVSYEKMDQARRSKFRPFPAKHKYLTGYFSNFQGIKPAAVQAAIIDTCESMLNPPANLLGINGILKFAKEVVKWNRFESNKLKIAGITNYFQISQDGGTGGGIFRKMYGEFLREAEQYLPTKQLEDIGDGFMTLSQQWDLLAEDMWQLGEQGNPNLLPAISKKIFNLYMQEKALLTRLLSAVKQIECKGDKKNDLSRMLQCSSSNHPLAES